MKAPSFSLTGSEVEITLLWLYTNYNDVIINTLQSVIDHLCSIIHQPGNFTIIKVIYSESTHLLLYCILYVVKDDKEGQCIVDSKIMIRYSKNHPIQESIVDNSAIGLPIRILNEILATSIMVLCPAAAFPILAKVMSQ